MLSAYTHAAVAFHANDQIRDAKVIAREWFERLQNNDNRIGWSYTMHGTHRSAAQTLTHPRSIRAACTEIKTTNTPIDCCIPAVYYHSIGE